MSDIIFSFDTEDFTSNYAADAIRDLAIILENEDIKGNFCMVGLVAKQLLSWKRYDVLEALKKHEIGFHSLAHSIHPTINEYTDIEDYKIAYDEFIKQECEGIGMVKAVTGAEKLYTAVPPGNCKSYVAMYAYSDLGIPSYCDSILETTDGAGRYFCNAFHLEYFIALEEIFFNNYFNLKTLIEKLAKRDKTIIYTHPNIILYNEFWDKVNYYKENLYSFGNWKEPQRRHIEEVEKFYLKFKLFIKELKDDGRFNFKTIKDIVEAENKKPIRIITKDMLPEIRKELLINFEPVISPMSFSISDIFCAVVSFFKGADSYIAEKSYGFLNEPFSVDNCYTLKASSISEAAKKIDINNFLPSKIEIDGINIGPADFLFAALDILCEKSNVITVKPRSQQIDLSLYPALMNLQLKGTWMSSDTFDDNYLSSRLRLQAWTIRY
ncbi:MAG: hypothetical protein K0S55_1803 [Clostridia bacterium]|nr:hypothetical protein [Clostridia bacterium]